jgi:lambda family phage tail tape measure protein
MADDFEGDLNGVEDAMAGVSQMAAALTEGLRETQEAMASANVDAEALSRGLSRGLRRAFDGIIFDGMKLSDALQSIARSMVNSAYSAALKPVTNGVASAIGGLFGGAFADGAAFSQGRVMPFAKGGVVTGPTAFPMRGATGLMGEAGPEAIMPLTRGADGRLGVRSSGGAGPVTVVMNINTPDAQSFQRSRSQIAAQMTRALSAGRRNG